MFWFILFSVLNIFFHIRAAINPENLKQNYTLLLKVTDQQNRIYVAAIPGKYLVDEEPLPLIEKYFMYEQKHWQEVCQMWQDVKSPEDVGCFFIIPQSIEHRSSTVIYKLPLQNNQEEVCSLQFGKNLTFQQAVLVINDFIDECLTKHKNLFEIAPETASSFSFDSFDVEFEENEITEYTTSNPPSGLMVYARQIGVAILMRSMTLTQYISNKWGEFRRYILG